MKLSEINLNELDFNNIGDWPGVIKAITLVFIVAVVVGVAYWVDTSDQMVRLEQAQTREPELKATLQHKAKLAANLAAYEDQLAEMRESFGALLRQLPNKTEVADLLVDISQTGLASGLEFELFRPNQEQPQEFYAELPISIRVKGTYHEFGQFISGLAALPRIVTMHNIAITPAGSEGQLTMELTARTYRYLDEQEGG